MEKLTGHGYPHSHFVGAVGQHYEDLDTGDLYECRIASKYSPTHGWPVGGYVWELRAKGEDIRELYGAGGSGSGGAVKEAVYVLGNMSNRPISEEDTAKVVDAIKTGKDIYQYMPYFEGSDHVSVYVEKARPLNFDYAEFDENGNCTISFTTEQLMSDITLTTTQVNEISSVMIEQAKKALLGFTLDKNADGVKLTLGSPDSPNRTTHNITEEQYEELLAFYEAKFGISLRGEEE